MEGTSTEEDFLKRKIEDYPVVNTVSFVVALGRREESAHSWWHRWWSWHEFRGWWMGPERLPPGDNTRAKPSECVTRVSPRSTEDSHRQGRSLGVSLYEYWADLLDNMVLIPGKVDYLCECEDRGTSPTLLHLSISKSYQLSSTDSPGCWIT